jgi:hypothetical protein
MDRLVFRAALRVSAKVALGAAVAGCGGLVGSTAERAAPEAGAPEAAAVSPEAAPEDAAAPVDVALADGSQVKAGACDPSSPSSVLPEDTHADAAAGITESTFDCCLAVLEAVPPNEGGFEFPDAAFGNPEVQACCATVIARLDHDYRDSWALVDAAQAILQGDMRAAEPIVNACCQVELPAAYGPTCTPWGPPMPPQMPGEVA